MITKESKEWNGKKVTQEMTQSEILWWKVWFQAPNYKTVSNEEQITYLMFPSTAVLCTSLSVDDTGP